MKESKMNIITMTIVGLLCLQVQSIESSGIFELSLSSLVDSFGRDLRDDCCGWQNASSSSQQSTAANHIASQLSSTTTTAHHQQHPKHQYQAQQHQQQAVSCDPSKCQLIIRICVKNYQTQIEPSQCTFGELSAQVLKQQLDPFSGVDSLSLPGQYQPLLRQNKATFRPSASSVTNIHQQRMLSQIQALPFFYNQQQQQSHHVSSAAARNQQQQQQLRNPLSAGIGQSRALRTVAFHQPISFPFNFTWPGSFSLIIDAWFESPLQQVAASHHLQGSHQQQQQQQQQQPSPTTTYDLYKRQLIIKHSMRGWLAVKQDWTNDVHKTDTATLAYSYRVTCQPNYYGEQCNILCRPRDDIYGHYTCSQQGNIVCLTGWQGSYCLEPICSQGCARDQGNCSRPNECSCRMGWQGPACEQCVPHPACVHGGCSKPHECICDEGWGGLLCSEDLNFCANHQPCKNDGICSSAFDSNGVGSYTCTCPPGFAGKSCERHQDQEQDTFMTPTSSNISIASLQQQVAPIQQQQQQQSQQLQQQQQVLNNKPTNKQPKQYRQQQQQQQQHQLGGLHYTLTQASSVNPTTGGSQQQPLDSWVMIGWAVIMICSIILVLVFSFRTAIERASQRGGHWYHQEGSQVEDVATLQNQQNLCKSRTSLNAAAAANMMMAASDADHKAAYGRVLSLVDGHEHGFAGIYGSRYGHSIAAAAADQPGTSSNTNDRFQSNQSNSNQRRADKGKKSHQKHQQQQQYTSQHNLHATHESNNNNNLDSSSSDATSSSSETLAPPPPYTIAQSTHSYPNLAYQTLSSHYSPAASARYLSFPGTSAAAAAAGQRAPKVNSQVTAISNAIYGSNALYGNYSTYAGIPVVAAPTNRQPVGGGGVGTDASLGPDGNNAAAAAANQSAHYLIYPVHFMAN